MASTPVEVKKATPVPTPVPDVWRSFRTEMDRLFDRFSGAFDMPSLRRMFDIEPAWRFDSSFGFAAPAIDVSEDDNAYRISAELPGLEAKDPMYQSPAIRSSSKEKSSRKKNRRTKTTISPNAPMARSSAPLPYLSGWRVTKSPPIYRRVC
jgi:hypothetical protein